MARRVVFILLRVGSRRDCYRYLQGCPPCSRRCRRQSWAVRAGGVCALGRRCGRRGCRRWTWEYSVVCVSKWICWGRRKSHSRWYCGMWPKRLWRSWDRPVYFVQHRNRHRRHVAGVRWSWGLWLVRSGRRRLVDWRLGRILVRRRPRCSDWRVKRRHDTRRHPRVGLYSRSGRGRYE